MLTAECGCGTPHRGRPSARDYVIGVSKKDANHTPAPSATKPMSETSSRGEIDAFIERARTTAPDTKGARGRLMFALDATMSRQPTWDRACAIQADMF